MKLSANQHLQLLWIHHCCPFYLIELTDQDVVDLELLIVNQYTSLSGPYFDNLIPSGKDALVEFFLGRSGESPFDE